MYQFKMNCSEQTYCSEVLSEENWILLCNRANVPVIEGPSLVKGILISTIDCNGLLGDVLLIKPTSDKEGD